MPSTSPCAPKNASANERTDHDDSAATRSETDAAAARATGTRAAAGTTAAADAARVVAMAWIAEVRAKDTTEADAILTAMNDPLIRAFVVTCGTLALLPDDAARSRVITWLADKVREELTAPVEAPI